MVVEVGDELTLEQSFRVIALDLSLRAAPIAGVTETIPTHRSLGLVFDPLIIDFSRLSAAIREREPDLASLRELPSRLMEIPLWYDDPWSDECARAHGVPNNMRFLAELNGVTVEEVVRRHSRTEHWLSAVGFQPATYQAIPLSASAFITAPKYERPRQSTPSRIVCLAGQITSFYPVESPGGYQLLGRTPVDLYDPEQRTRAFADSPVLPKVGDRHRYVPIGEEEYGEIRARVEAGTYELRTEGGIVRLPEVAAA
jgi:urea carboxylase